MLFLSRQESETWTQLGREILKNQATFRDYQGAVRSNLTPVFCSYIGGLLAAKGQEKRGAAWFKDGILEETDEFLFNAFVFSFLERQKGRLVQPAVVFEDPRPFVHFSGVPIMKNARRAFMNHFGHSLPRFDRPFRFMDIGCGDGGLTAAMIGHLRKMGKVGDIEEILLIDRSQAMVDMAVQTLEKAIPETRIRGIHSRIEDIAGKIDTHYDVAMSSLAYHHMPVEQKEVHLNELIPWIDHFVIFELDGNNDTPALHSPELALSMYQSYGRMIEFVFALDRPIDVV